FIATGVHRDGALAERVLLPSGGVAGIDDEVDAVQAAPLADAGVTTYHAIERSAHVLQPDGFALVIGVGGLGHLAVQMLAHRGSKVIAVDVAPAKLELAERLGAVRTFLAEGGPEKCAGSIRDATGGAGGVDAAFDFVGSDDTLLTASLSARPGGVVSLTGTG